MQFRDIAAAAAAAIALTVATSASAAVTQLQFTAPSAGPQIYFNGLVPGTSDPYPGLGATFTLALDSITNGGYRWNFSYQLANVSTLDSRLTVVGWDIDADLASASGLSGLFTTSGSGNMSFGGAKDFCLKASGGSANCSGGGGGGLDEGTSGSGVFSLNFASQIVGGTNKHPIVTPVAAPTELTFNNFGVHYQSVPLISSTVGVPGVPPPEPQGGVPEPATWAMLILGFFGMGSAIRRRARSLRLA